MPQPSPFHPRTEPLCESREWRDWAGYLAAATYEHTHEREYYAIRNAVALIDVSPLYKYEITGSHAQRLVDRIVTRDMRRCSIGQMRYTPWCDDDGKVIDDGTIACLGEEHYRITAAEPNLAWFQDCGYSLEAEVVDVSDQLAALALQGPLARTVLAKATQVEGLSELRFYHLTHESIDGVPVTISRTGYTGDLGYELWMDPDHALQVWDALMEAGRGQGIAPAGMVALDIARIEAGLLLIQVDYVSARKALIESQKSSPFELGLGWTVDLEKAPFVGQKALIEEKQRGSVWNLVGLEVEWPALESEYARVNLAPQVAGRASRTAVPIYQGKQQVGHATSQTFSPSLKKYIALATLESRHAQPGTPVEIEVTIEYVRRQSRARVVKLPFLELPRRKAT